MTMRMYLDLVEKEVPRLLSLLDREACSASYGCFDRQYWKYKTRDYNNARFQEAALTLTLLYLNPKSRWYDNPKIRDLAIASCRFWARTQHNDGSYDEYMPNQKSHVATAFSALSIASSYRQLALNDKEVLAALKKAAKWLAKNDDLDVINHDAGCVPFFYILYKLTGKEEYLHDCKVKLKKVLDNMDEEGWFKEYGGADIGYQSYSIYFLAKYLLLSNDESIIPVLNKAIDFFAYFVHPDGTLGGKYGSRDTSFIIVAGFELLKGMNNKAAKIADVIKDSLTKQKIIGPYSFDDRFLAEELYTYIDFEDSQNNTISAKLPCEEDTFKHFPNCGLVVQKKNDHYCIFNTKKGGCGKIFKKGRLIYDFSGWVMNNKKGIITSGVSSTPKQVNQDSIIIKGKFTKVNTMMQKPWTMVALRAANKSSAGKYIFQLMRHKFIKKPEETNIRYERTIQIRDNITITDVFKTKDNIQDKVTFTDSFSPIYSTSVHLYEENTQTGEYKIEKEPNKIIVKI